MRGSLGGAALGWYHRRISRAGSQESGAGAHELGGSIQASKGGREALNTCKWQGIPGYQRMQGSTNPHQENF